MRLGGLSAAGLSLPTLLSRAASPTRKAAKSCILVFMDGGPSQLETWDVKPNAPEDVRGQFKAIASSVPGAPVCELLPQMAKVMHRVAQVRSVNHKVTDHNAGSYYMLTGKSPVDGARLILTDAGNTFPSFGSVVAQQRPAKRRVPPYVLLPEYQFNNGFDIGGQKSGFLGPKFDPFVAGDPSEKGYRVPGLDLASDLPVIRLSERDNLLRAIDSAKAAAETNAARMSPFQRQAFDMLMSPDARLAFDLEREPARVRERYGLAPEGPRGEARKFGGLPHLGQCMLMARRLIEAGVRLVTVITGRQIDQAWDTHRDHVGLMKDSLCPPFDRAMSALMTDLAERGLLDETLVVVTGEFGRTPKMGYVTSGAGATKNGRDHWPFCYTALFAGAGVPGGAIIGSSDKIAAYPKENPVGPEDVAASIYHLLGIDPATEIRDGQDRPYTLSAGSPIRGLA
jgi:hypothetical protein